MHVGISRRITAGGTVVYPTPTLTSVVSSIGDTATANAGIILTGTNYTRADGSPIVLSVWFGSSQATITAITKNGGGAGIDTITVTSPSLAIGTYDVRAVTSGGSATISNAYDAWDPIAAGSSLGWWRADSGKTLDGDGKVITWASKDAIPVVCTLTVRPTPFADESLGGRTALNFAGGCYGTASVNTTNQVVIKVVGYTSSAIAYCVCAVDTARVIWSNTSSKWTSFDGANAPTLRSSLSPTVFMQRFTGDANAKQYANSLTPGTVNCGSAANRTTFLIGSASGGNFPWNGAIAEVLVTTAAIANDPLSMRHSAAYFGLTLGA